MTQRELAERVKVGFSYLSKIESGAMPPPSQKAISKLAEALNADQDELLILAGKVPSDIAQILKNGKTLQHLRSAQIKQMARASGKRGGATNKIGQTMRRLPSLRGLAKVAIPLVLVVAVAASLWFAAPVRALEITIDNPSSGTLGRSYSFTVEVDISDSDLLPIRSVDLYIFENSAYTSDNSPHKATCTDLPLNDGGTASYSDTDTGGGGTVDVTASTVAGWGYGYGYRYGYGYAVPGGWGYHYFGTSGGYGYGYGGYQGATGITYNVTWRSPSGWPEGGYRIEVRVNGNGKYFTETSSEFTLSSARAQAPAPVVLPGVTDVSDYVDEDGVFTEDVTAESEDGKVELSVDDGTTGLIDGEPLSEISITEMDEPPAPPEDSNVIGLVYDFGPDEATFEPAITLTFTYDPALIPEGVAEEDLVIAIWVWDEAAGEWVWDELSPCTVDPVTNTISAPVSHFTAFAVLAYTGPAAFTASDLVITPTEVDTGQTVTISVMVANTGDLAGSYEVTLKINNVVADARDITVAGGASQKVTFTTTEDVAGTYAVNVDGLTGTFTVKVPPAPAAFTASDLVITPTEVDTGQTVTISVLVANTSDLAGSYEVTLKINNVVVDVKDITVAGGASQKVTFTTTEDVAGTYAVNVDGLTGTFIVKAPPVPPKLVNWWLIGGIIAAVVGIALVIILVVRRQRA